MMEPVKFKGANVTFAKDQPEYLPLPAFVDRADPAGTVVSCWKLTWLERLKVFFTGRLYLSQLTFHHPLQPQRPTADIPLTFH